MVPLFSMLMPIQQIIVSKGPLFIQCSYLQICYVNFNIFFGFLSNMFALLEFQQYKMDRQTDVTSYESQGHMNFVICVTNIFWLSESNDNILPSLKL